MWDCLIVKTGQRSYNRMGEKQKNQGVATVQWKSRSWLCRRTLKSRASLQTSVKWKNAVKKSETKFLRETDKVLQQMMTVRVGCTSYWIIRCTSVFTGPHRAPWKVSFFMTVWYCKPYMFHKALRIIKVWVTQVYPFVLLKVLMLLNRLVDHFVTFIVCWLHTV